MQPLSATLSASYEKLLTEAASEFVTVAEWMAVLRRSFHNRQAEMLWCHAVASHSLAQMPNAQTMSVPPVIIQTSTGSLSEVQTILDSAGCQSAPAMRGSGMVNHKGLLWYHDVPIQPRQLRLPWVAISNPHAAPPSATWLWLVPTDDHVTDYEATTLGASARDAVLRIVKDQALWAVWDARLFHARAALDKMGWASPAATAPSMAMMATLRHGTDPSRDAGLWESVTPTRDFYVWAVDRLLFSVAAKSIREMEHVSLERWVRVLTRWNDDECHRIASGMLDIMDVIPGVRTRGRTLSVELDVRTVRAYVTSKTTGTSALKFAARPVNKDALAHRTVDLLGEPENHQHL